MLAACSADGTFTPEEVIREGMMTGSWFRESTIRTCITSTMCVNAPAHASNHTDDVVRVARGLYRVIGHQPVQAEQTTDSSPEAAEAGITVR